MFKPSWMIWNSYLKVGLKYLIMNDSCWYLLDLGNFVGIY